MMKQRHGPRIAPAIAVAAAALTWPLWPSDAQQAPADELASHRAIYELKLASNRGKSAVGARGRILYDFSGNSCDGYTLEFRQVAELDNGEGRVTLSDLRTSTWEDVDARNYRFMSQNYLNQKLIDAVDGKAERHTGMIEVTLSKPKERKFDLESGIVFPTEHVRRTLIAAREGKTILELPVYDGSETGEKVYNTLTVIGRAIEPGERVLTDAAAGQKALAGMKRWPVTVSYFDRAAKSGEQMPVYAISFEIYENGVSRALVLDYNTFSISGDLSSLEMRETKPCK